MDNAIKRGSRQGRTRGRMVPGSGKLLWPMLRTKRYYKIAKSPVDNFNSMNMKKEWPLWEIFIRSRKGLEHRHVGSLHAADATMALENARDVYTRRNEGVSIWAIESKHITATNPEESGEFFEPAQDKVYRHPSFYKLPDELKYI